MHVLMLAAILRTAAIDDAVSLVMRAQHIAGISVGIARNGDVLYERGYGERDVLRRLPAQVQTVYRIGSLTKMFTARAVMLLAERKKVALDESAQRYLERFPWGPRVTVRDLLAQRSGIPSYTDAGTLNPYAWYAPEQLADAVAQQRLQFAPGTQFAYSNTNYVILGMIAEHVTRQPFEDFLNAHVIAPMRLRNTRYGDQPGEALGYSFEGANFSRATPSMPAYAFSAAAMTSNVPDLLRFLLTMRPPYYGLLQSEQFRSDVWYASGNVDGYSAFAFLVPQTGEEAAILCNAGKIDLAPLALDILSALQPSNENTIGPAENEDPQITAQIRRRAAAMFSPRQVTLVEFLNRETSTEGASVEYRVTLSDGSRVQLRAKVSANGALGEISVTPL